MARETKTQNPKSPFLYLERQIGEEKPKTGKRNGLKPQEKERKEMGFKLKEGKSSKVES